jgi:hypothetical protein
MDALDEPVVRARLAEIGQEIFPREQQTPETLGALQAVGCDMNQAGHDAPLHPVRCGQSAALQDFDRSYDCSGLAVRKRNLIWS